MDFAQDYKHTPVLVGEVVLSLRPQAQGVYVDATLGEGGHAAATSARYCAEWAADRD